VPRGSPRQRGPDLREERRRELRAADDAGLDEDLLQVVLDGVRGEEERVGDLRIGESPDGQAGDLSFARGQAVRVGPELSDLVWRRGLQG
jgi:hypothetical protein